MQWLDLRSGLTFEHAHDLATGDHNGKQKVKQIDNRNMSTFDVQILIFTAGKTKREAIKLGANKHKFPTSTRR